MAASFKAQWRRSRRIAHSFAVEYHRNAPRKVMSLTECEVAKLSGRSRGSKNREILAGRPAEFCDNRGGLCGRLGVNPCSRWSHAGIPGFATAAGPETHGAVQTYDASKLLYLRMGLRQAVLPTARLVGDSQRDKCRRRNGAAGCKTQFGRLGLDSDSCVAGPLSLDGRDAGWATSEVRCAVACDSRATEAN